ncbi:MAG: AAA family ATPase [Ignavibacterium sp.]|nr:AAA family ATPase [Ignavibacterium sp.]MDW8375790.1 AAA family ATPase [Ignavibacteriales bacterium]
MNYQEEIIEHFKNGRIKLALILSKKFYEEEPDNFNSLILYSKALIENFNPFLAIQIANEAVDSFKKIPEVYLNRAEILYRTSIFSGALYDIQNYLKYQSDDHAIILHSKILAANENFDKAIDELSKVKQKNDETKSLEEVYKLCNKIIKRDKVYIDEIERLLSFSVAFKKNEIFWLPIWISNKFLEKINNEELKDKIELFEFFSHVDSFRIKDAEKKLEQLKEKYADDENFEKAISKLKTIKSFKDSAEDYSYEYEEDDQAIIKKEDQPIKLISARFFNLAENIRSGKRKYLLQFDESNLDYVAVEVLIKNPYYKKYTEKVKGLCVWYLNDKECGKHRFDLELNKDWDIIELVQSWGNEEKNFWRQGHGKLDFFINGRLLFSKRFLIDENEILNTESIPELNQSESFNKQQTEQPDKVEEFKQKGLQEESLTKLIDELHSYIGLDSLKQSLVDFITYLNFINERKKKGIKTEEQLELHCIFLGNPGTGKTTIARLLGKIFKAMGILENGHVVEVDRSGLVGQYIGETAVKTDKMIQDALGGILFIDEAYTLKKQGISSDFGQEAIDILLKRMEDLRGKFVVIAAGYPGPMKDFIESNPGLQSRFTHTFIFDDYLPNQLTEIFKFFAKKEEYILNEDAEKFLLEKFQEIFENRDETFGNARLARKIFNETKIQIGKRFQNASESEKENFSLNLITIEDIKNAFGISEKESRKKQIEESQLESIIKKVNDSIGITNFKREINEIIKLAKYYIEEGEDLNEKFNFNFIFAGNPGTGKRTSAKILTELFFNLGLVSKNHFVEVEYHSLIGNNLEQSLEKLSKVFDKASYGVLYINNFDILIDNLRYRTDISNEFIEQFIKRISSKAPRILVVIGVANDFIYHYSKEFAPLKHFFNKVITFDDFTSLEIIELTKKSLSEKNLFLSEESLTILSNFIEQAIELKNQYPQNANLVKYLVDTIQRKHLLRLSEIPKNLRNEEITSKVSEDVIKETIDAQILYENNLETSTPSSLKKYIDDLNKLVGHNQIKEAIQNIINSEKVASIRRERGLNVLPKSFHALFIGNRYTGKSTIARIYAGILKELGILHSNEVIEIDSISISSFNSEKNLLQNFEGKLIFIDNASNMVYSDDILLRETISRIFATVKEFKDKFVMVISDTKLGINLTLDKHNELRILFRNEFIFNDFTPREMLEIALNFTQQYGYQLDEGAWQLMLEIFTEIFEKGDVNFLNTKAVYELIYKVINQQEDRLSKLNNVSDSDLVTLTFEDVKNIYKPN